MAEELAKPAGLRRSEIEQCLRRAWQVDQTPSFDALLGAIDRADATYAPVASNKSKPR